MASHLQGLARLEDVQLDIPVVSAKPVRLRDQELLDKWQERTFKALEQMKDATENGKSHEAKNWATSAGIGTDKILILGGRPTQIVAGLHEVRHTLPAITEKLLAVATKIGLNKG